MTLDLPFDQGRVPDKITQADAAFINSSSRRQRKFLDTPQAAFIKELFGDSMTFDISAAIASPIEFAFIDGSHSYEYVKSDTERILPLLANDAIVAWHDYCRSWPGVIKYLNELGRLQPLRHIDGTTVVYLEMDAN